jgi:hypothetical protein
VNATLTVAVIAVVISALSCAAAGFALFYSHRADRRAEAQDERDAQRFEREIEDAVERDSAILTAEVQGPAGSSFGREYRVIVTNLGPAPAHRLSVWFVDQDGREIGHRVGGRTALMPGESAKLTLFAPVRADYGGTLNLHYGWTDGTGTKQTGSSADVEL